MSGFFGRTLDFSLDQRYKLFILECHLIFEFSDLQFDHLVRFFDLEISDLGAKWLDLVSNLLDELSSLLALELHWTRLHHLRHAAHRSPTLARTRL